MEDLPNRHRNHEIETLSERYFQNFIPISWVVNPFRLDYGTDYNCEITVDNKVSGMNFSVQLKGKETELDKEFIKIILKKTTITRWLNRLEPTMIIAFIVDENKAFWTRYAGFLNHFASKTNDLFLRANHQSGIQSYDEMVQLLVCYYRKSKEI